VTSVPIVVGTGPVGGALSGSQPSCPAQVRSPSSASRRTRRR
jgi:hypothetical protein